MLVLIDGELSVPFVHVLIVSAAPLVCSIHLAYHLKLSNASDDAICLSHFGLPEVTTAPGLPNPEASFESGNKTQDWEQDDAFGEF